MGPVGPTPSTTLSPPLLPIVFTNTCRQEIYDQLQPYYCSNHQPLLCSPLIVFRSRHLVCGILWTFTLAQLKLSLPSKVD